MILNITDAQYLNDYKILLSFDTGETKMVDLKNTIFNDTRKIFSPLRDKNYFKRFSIRFNTITWENEADFAPEFLYEISNENEEKVITSVI